MAEPFATRANFLDRGHVAGSWSATVLETRLAAASRWLRGQYPDIDDRIEAEEIDPELVTDVVCMMTARTVPVELVPLGLDSTQMAGGPFSQSGKLTNPHGDYYLTKQERATLGYGGGKAFTVNLLPDPDEARF